MFQRLNIRDITPQIIDWARLNIFKKIKTFAKRTAKMHIAIDSEFEETTFTPKHFNDNYTVWLKKQNVFINFKID